jgi:glutaminyl-tRNA synthetase
VTHSICTTEFEEQRPLYDWVVRECEMPNVPHQYEFGKLKLSDTIMGKRYLRQLVEEKLVDGWDDPRMPTVSGLRRRGYTPEAIQAFCRETGVSKGGGVIDLSYLEHFVREDLKLKAPRTMAVLQPLKVVITNYPEDKVEWLDAENNTEAPEMGNRQIPFSREVYVERDDFMEEPVKGYHRLVPGNEVRLKHAYFIKCEEVVKNAAGEVVELRCTYDPETKSGSGFTARKVKGTIHWVEAKQGLPVEFRLYEPLLAKADAAVDAAVDADEDEDTDGAGGATFINQLNPKSVEIVQGFVEPNMKGAKPQDKFQFFRHGYFNVDPKHTTADKLVFNRIVSLKSSFDPAVGGK